MLEIIVTIPPARDRAAGLRIVAGWNTVIDDWAVATVDPAFAKRAKNTQADSRRPGGHPPLGRYELTAQGPVPPGTETEYGRALLLFEPASGEALDAESYGRLGLLVYAGRMAPDTRLRRTQGGLRLSGRAMDLLLARIDATTPVELRIELATKPPWWAFWRRQPEHPPLSERPPQFDVPPLDEATLMAALMQRSQRRARPEREHDEWERRRERDREQQRDSGSSSSDTPEFRGCGGEGGGAGASGGWSDAPAAGRGPGVDAAGRIVTAAGVAAVATAAVIAAREAAASHASSVADRADAGSAEQPPSDGDSASAPSSDSGADAGWSTTSTSY